MYDILFYVDIAFYKKIIFSAPIITINGDETHDIKDRFYKAGSAIKLSCIISEEYALLLPTKTVITTSPTTTTSTSTTTTTTTELTTKLSTIFNSLDIMMNKSWSVQTSTVTSTSSTSTTTRTPIMKTTTELTTMKPTIETIVNNVYGIIWRKQGKNFIDNVTWRNLRYTN